MIEDHANGQSLIQDLKNENIYNIVPIKHKLDKVSRFTSILPFFQSQKVYFHNRLPAAILQEIYNFPHTKHDDVIDSISQFLRYIQTIDFKINSFRIR